jgi:transcriptional regulator with XRE-family HTH domain
LAVRDARNAKSLTQSQVAEAMEWSLSKVMRIESGEVTISQNDLRPLLSYLGIRDRALVEELVGAAKASKQRRQWWDEKRFHGLLTAAMKQLVSFETEAATLHPLDNPFPGIGQFEILYLDSGDDAPAVLYRESLTLDEIIDDASRIAQHRSLLDRMWASAFSEDESAELIRRRAEDLGSTG